MASAASILASEEDGATVLRAKGEWLVITAAELDRRLHDIAMPQGRQVKVDLSGVDRLDSAGAWLLLRTEHELTARGNRVEMSNLQPRFAPLLFEQVRSGGVSEPLPHPVPPHHTFVGFLARIGRITVVLANRVYDILGFTGLVTITLLRLLRRPRRLRLVATLVQMEVVGLDAMPIVGLLSFLIGVVMAYQGADQLRRFGAEIYTVNLLGVSILRELGVLLSAIIIAGRSGSAFTAQIGTMQVNEEIDALRTLGLDPIEVLVLPRLLGLGLTLPLLVFFADFMGILGGGLMSWAVLDINIPNFLTQLQSAVSNTTLWVGFIKAPFFAAIIALVGCYEGLNVTRSAESVGRLTTQSVVESIFFVIVTDAAFSIIFSMLPRSDMAEIVDEASDDIVIRVRDLVNAFGRQVIHDGVDLDVRRGEVIGIVGGSGTGKSVMLRTVVGLNRPVSGSIEVLGRDVLHMDDEARHELETHWGVLFQDGALFSSLTVAQNIEVPLKEDLRLPSRLMAEIAATKISMVGLPAEAADKFPAQLSGGMRKRAGLARALALDPQILFLDEPTAGLDPIAAAAFDQLIKDLQSSLGLTVFLVTHDLDSLFAICDRVAVLIDKKIRVGTLEEHLRDDHPWIHSYFHGPRGRAALAAGPGARAP